MAHYALLDENNIVINVFVGKNENEEGVDWEKQYGEFHNLSCKRTSYNTYANQHPDGTPFRKNYASIGFFYDAEKDAFIPPKPFNSWYLNQTTFLWEPPVNLPEDANTGTPPKTYSWDETTLSWVAV